MSCQGRAGLARASSLSASGLHSNEYDAWQGHDAAPLMCSGCCQLKVPLARLAHNLLQLPPCQILDCFASQPRDALAQPVFPQAPPKEHSV